MKRFLSLTTLLLLITISIQSQTVGLVLSGGGAKGIAHIGLIKALEERGIPIDYVTGTSMGAIVGGWYAIGLSPEEMIALIKSDNFKAWQSGKIEAKDKLYFKSEDPTPEFASVSINLWDSTKATTSFLPMSLINPVQMNLGIIEMFAQPSAACGGDFDKLMIPFRCVASDVYHKNAIIHKSGDLGNSIRSSMTIPLAFKPIRIDGNLLYDGGIYNNFPTDVMANDFNPDFMIGSIVASAPVEPDENNLMDQIFTMVMQRTNYSIEADKGVAIKHDVERFGLLDFEKVDEIYAIGYKQGVKLADSLLNVITRRVSPESVTTKRLMFKCHYPILKFKEIHMTGVNSIERLAIMTQIPRNKKGEVSYEDFKASYFRLMSDNKLKELNPEVKYIKEKDAFDLNLAVKPNRDISLGIGGLITSAAANQAYIGVKYQTYTPYNLNMNSDIYVGNTYSSAMASGRIELPTKRPIYMRFSAVISSRSYFQSDRLFNHESVSAYLKQGELYGRLLIGTPLKKTSRMSLSFAYGRLSDQYSQTPTTTGLDNSVYYFGNILLRAHYNTLNHIMYPSHGMESIFMLQGFSGKERVYAMANDSLLSNKNRSWIQAEFKITNYASMNKQFSIGTLVNGVASNKPLYDNYTATVLQAPAFTPTPHSKVQFNESLRAMNYIAAGVIPVWTHSSGLQVRTELYGFLPLNGISGDGTGKPYFESFGRKIQYIGELSLVVNTPIASIAIYGNHYSYPKGNWNIGVNIGFLIMNPKFIL